MLTTRSAFISPPVSILSDPLRYFILFKTRLKKKKASNCPTSREVMKVQVKLVETIG
jgi:hypothetical protein